MKKNNFSKKEWIDLVFENRNKSYGAYQLRLQSGDMMLKALFIGIMIVALLVSVPVIASHFFDNNVAEEPVFDPTNEKIVVIATKQDEKKEDKIIEVQKQKGKQKSAEDIVKYVAATITEKTIVDTEMTSKDEIDDNKTGSATIQGSEDGFIDAINPFDENIEGSETGANVGDVNGVENAVIDTHLLDRKAEFPGGMSSFTQQIKRHFRTPEMDKKSVTVYVSFVVEVDGTITDIKILRDPGFGLAKETIRTLNRINVKWNPGIYKGKPVRTLYNLPIKVDVS